MTDKPSNDVPVTITCPNCGTEVYKVISDLRHGKMIMASDFEGINGYESAKAGERISCPACGDSDLLHKEIMMMAASS